MCPCAPQAYIIFTADNDSAATEAAFVSALVARRVPLMMNGRTIPAANPIKNIPLTVSKVTRQECVKATIIAAIMQVANSIKVPSISEIPTCNVLAVLVIVPAAAPEGIESRTWTVWLSRHER